MKAKERKAVVVSAKTAGETVNKYVVRAVNSRMSSEKKTGKPWIGSGKRARIQGEGSGRERRRKI
jgi:hypothetical protein